MIKLPGLLFKYQSVQPTRTSTVWRNDILNLVFAEIGEDAEVQTNVNGAGGNDRLNLDLGDAEDNVELTLRNVEVVEEPSDDDDDDDTDGNQNRGRGHRISQGRGHEKGRGRGHEKFDDNDS